MSTHLIIPDFHAHYRHNNDRAIWIGKLIRDVRPDVVVNLGDSADMPSLSGYDKGRASFQGRTYRADINAHADFQDKLWSTVRSGKKRMPRRIVLIGNHEQRISRALDIQPELNGAIGYGDLELERWYDDVVHYVGNTPGTIECDGITYAHYFVSGVMGRSIGGEHPAHSLLVKEFQSCTQGHAHVFDYSVRTRANGKKIMGLVAGCVETGGAEWAGEAAKLWWRGVFVKRNVEDGCYDLEAVSLARLKAEYSGRT